VLISIAVFVFLLIVLLFLPSEIFQGSQLKKMVSVPTIELGNNNPGNAIFKRATRIYSSLAIRFNLRISSKKRIQYEEKLIVAGLRNKWSPMDMMASKVIFPFVIFLFYLFLAVIRDETLFYLFSIILPAVAYGVPDIWLNSQVKKRQETIRRELPHYVNGIAVMCEAGLNLFPAIREVTLRKKGLLTDEFEQVLQKISVGLSQSEALDEMAERCQVEELSRFVSVINQAMERGATGITDLLRNQAKEIWEQRKKKAQQLGAEASMKLFLPLLLLVFPATVIFILGPILLELFKFIVS
jgi:tight adherence protein C